MKPCKHLDHNEENYPACELVTLEGFSCQVKHWYRPHAEDDKHCQFCGLGKGRINGIFQCYNESETHCHEPIEGDNND